MVLARNDYYLSIGRFVDKTMFVGDATRPISFEVTLQRFGFSDASERCFGSFTDKAAKALEDLLIRKRPFVVLVKGQFMKGDNSH